MENKINIAKLLENCPKGMKLYSPIFGEVYLDKIRPYLAIVVTTDKEQGYPKKEFLYDGRYGMNGECMLFPSKGKTTWEGFVPPCKFKNGDIVATSSGNWIAIVKGGEKGKLIPVYCVLRYNREFEVYCETKEEFVFSRLATEEEKEKLFQIIKNNGYRWNAETKTLEKLIEPKFKVGDRIRHKASSRISTIIDIGDGLYITGNGNITKGNIPFSVAESDFELITKFDISTLIPFESRVLVRDDSDECWIPAIWAFKKENKDDIYSFVVVGGNDFVCCIPYDGNQHLLGTTNSCSEFYKSWE